MNSRLLPSCPVTLSIRAFGANRCRQDLWITLLAMADQYARRRGCPRSGQSRWNALKKAQTALDKFMAPDPWEPEQYVMMKPSTTRP